MTARLALAAAVSTFALATPAPAIELASPIACPRGMVCPVQNLFDQQPGPGVRDFRCTALTYDGHDGVDFRAPTTAAQRAGVDVTAAAAGVVLGFRDGMADVGIAGAGGREALKSVECGNGVVLRHPGGWDTQYCHMAKGSIAVKKGDQVTRGQTLGRIGLSGMTEFPHLHFALRLNGKPVDPFALDGVGDDCAGPLRSAWTTEAQIALAPKAPLVLNAGFTDGPAPAEDIESGVTLDRAPGRDPQALVAFGRAIGLATGDGMRVTLKGPDGAEIARNDVPPVANPKAQFSAFTGRKRPPAGWTPGRYVGRVEILRAGKPLSATEFSLDLGG